MKRGWWSRLVGAILLTLFAVTVGAMGASAIEVPDPQFPNAGMAGAIDPGPGELCSRTDTSLYCQYGYGGWLPVTVDPGWGWVPDAIEDKVREGVQQVQDVTKPVNGAQEKTGRALSNVTQFWVALCVLTTRLAFNAPELWGLFDPITDTLQHVFGGRVYAMFFSAACAITALWIASKAHKGEVQWAARVTFHGMTILAVGLMCAVWVLGPGALFDRTLNQGFAAVSQAAGGNARSAEVATANVLFDNVIWPSYVESNFGDNEAAADKYAKRLHSATSLTREEAAQIAILVDGSDQALKNQKRAETETIVKEIQAEYPGVFDQYLRNANTTGRIMTGAAGLLAVLSAGLVLMYVLTIVALCRLGIRFVVAIFPTASLVLQFPTLQHHAATLALTIGKVFAYMFGAITAYVVFLNVIVTGILSAPIPIYWRIAGLVLLIGILWRARRLLETQIKTAARQARDASNEIRGRFQRKETASGTTSGRTADDGDTGSTSKVPSSRLPKIPSKRVTRADIERADLDLVRDIKWAPLANPDRYQYRTNEKGKLEKTEFGRKVEADKARTTLKQKSAVNAAALAAVVVTKNPKSGATVKKAGTVAAQAGAEHKARKTTAKRESNETRQRMADVPASRLSPTQTRGMVPDLGALLHDTPKEKVTV